MSVKKDNMKIYNSYKEFLQYDVIYSRFKTP